MYGTAIALYIIIKIGIRGHEFLYFFVSAKEIITTYQDNDMWIDKSVDRESPQKLYIQIHDIIKEKIEKGEWPANTHIPTEDELCRLFNVSKATVRLAVAELVKDGLVRRQQGKGTFVATDINQLGMVMKTRLTEDMFGKGVTVTKSLISEGVRVPEDSIRNLFAGDETIYYALCIATVGGEPAYVDELFIPLSVFPGISEETLCNSPFYDLIQERAVRKIFKVIQTIEVTGISGELAGHLGVREGASVFLIHRLLVGSDGGPIAYMRLNGNPGRYKVQTEFERIK